MITNARDYKIREEKNNREIDLIKAEYKKIVERFCTEKELMSSDIFASMMHIREEKLINLGLSHGDIYALFKEYEDGVLEDEI